MAISSPGIGSNLDVNGIVTQLMALERRPLTLLDSREAGYQAKVSAYGSLKGALSVFQTAMAGLTTGTRFQANLATVADPTVITAAAEAGAAAGSYTVSVGQIARAHTLQAAGIASDTAASSTGSITLRVGNGPIKTVTLDASNNTLRGLRDAINAAGAGVTATIVNDGSATPFRLVLSAGATGAANSIVLSNGLTAGDLKDALDGSTTAQTPLDATLTVNGVAITSASNTVNEAVNGLSLTLLKAGATTFTVSRDKSQAQAAVQGFVKSYNDINKVISDLTGYDAATRKGGLLVGDSTAVGLRAQIRSALSAALAGLDGNITQLSQIGVSFQRDGSLALDSAKLSTALDGSATEVAALFGAQGKSSSALLSYVTSGAPTQPGNYDVDITAAATQGSVLATGAPAASTVIDGTNNSIAISIDGKASGTLTLAQGTYTPAQLVTVLQDALDGSATLASSGVSAVVALDGGRIRITSDSFGVQSTAGTLSGTAMSALGYAGSESGTGTDVQGSFSVAGNTIAATGTGQILKAATGSVAEGLQVRYTGTAGQVQAGTDAVLRFSQGYAARLDQLATRFLATGGPINARSDGIAASIKDLEKQRAAVERRMVAVEAQLRSQFTALDGLIGRLSSTSNFLTQQLAQLSSLSPTNRG